MLSHLRGVKKHSKRIPKGFDMLRSIVEGMDISEPTHAHDDDDDDDVVYIPMTAHPVDIELLSSESPSNKTDHDKSNKFK